ncbi:glycosyltransferase [Oleiagrimonas sp. MCCC 1A03011]|uniref:glycosyltransferase n=1 Tax=Oleiagrimonas sp. MCCC 1A03011 TaxID=1926883 RepID=UPI000DC262E3|nr:glycosyltransferase [Oleiagrimonas sp. MCCC 1A03011]RAP58428.1 hypothetical protein BTJ49_05640 [Oleiagrimonas sp. MCCC 1A03011]
MNTGKVQRRALLIVGMHRSGTSALTRVINLHGAALGSHLPQGAYDNERGFWENQRFVDFHERLLASLGSSWDDPRLFPGDWLQRVVDAGFEDELCSLISDEFGETPLWAVKDPRICRFLPLWLRALERCEIEASMILAFRNPAEVADSLTRRNRLSTAAGTVLWLRHLAEPLEASKTVVRCAVDYQSLLADWRTCMRLIADRLELRWPVASDTCAGQIAHYLDAGLRHEVSSPEREIFPVAWGDYVRDIHEACRVLERVGEGWDVLQQRVTGFSGRLDFCTPLIDDLQPKSIRDALRNDLDQLGKDRGAYKAEARRLYTEIEKRVEQIGELQAQLRASSLRVEELLHTKDALVQARGEVAKARARIRMLKHAERELGMVLQSRSWRWMRPFRVIMRTLRNRGLTAEDRAGLQRMFGHRAPQSAPSAHSRGSDTPVRNEGGVSERAAATAISVSGELTEQCRDYRDYFVFSVIDWHFRTQRPQHLARELARTGHRVFYISNNFIDSAVPGFEVEQLDDDGRLFQVHLNLQGAPAIYHALPTRDEQDSLRASMAALLEWTRTRGCASLVQHPYWLQTARTLPDSRMVYDCMDHHGGFADNTPEVLARERELMQQSDLLVVTSDWLQREVGEYNPNVALIRNACEYEHFCGEPEEVYRDPDGRRIIGYYGAIAEWFDLDLVEKVAQRFPDCLVLLVGADTTGAADSLGDLDNVEFTGEVPYGTLPRYLAAFDVCMLPFQVIPLTLATNPVKVYEYLSAGKEVVSVDLPEIAQFGGLVRCASTHEAFLDAVGEALQAPAGDECIKQRQDFASRQTWAHRATDLLAGMDALCVPQVSVVVVTYNNLDLTKVCLRSLEAYSNYPNMEVIVVDNASADGSPDFLREWERGGPQRRVVLNEDNRGFAAANNQGLDMATGEYLVMLNNDTHVTPGWIATLKAHLMREPLLGMVGPVTNNIGNEARIDIDYNDMDQMLVAAERYTRRHAGMLTPLRTAAFFCVMMPRSVYEKVGPLDEAFGVGFFEDDDYCRRIEQEGWSIACAEDVFIHHHLSASFDKMKQEKRKALFETNKALYEKKWGTWVAHSYRKPTRH